MEINTQNIRIHHYSIAVKNLAKSVEFYHSILGLKLIPRPLFDFEGAWFDIGNGIELHLIEDTEHSVNFSSSRSLHFAFEVKDIFVTKKYLIEKSVKINKDIKPRPDGPLQLFVKDPDGYFIEFTQLTEIQ